ncbi:GH16572 [Drosophila grimshawi]|uniref:GH16572 n=2 Tax=Drosophila grimshawi TaxID=7222 RepID=B4J1P8_DROGR|nr:GH16572 [Drosophila grimshawi]
MAATLPSPAKQRMVVTPWRDTTEFSTVYDWLFSKQTTTANRRKALSQMRIWSLRRGSLCPAAVLATGVLMKAQLEDKQGNPNIRTTYASSFTRFFNFMSSIMQSHNMTSMYNTARQLGLQSFIVDLRHLCAHGQELPPTAVLRNTAEHCVEWLRNFYWLPQTETMNNLDAPKLQRKDMAKFEKELGILFEMYDLALECQLKGAQKLKEIKKLRTSAEFNKMRVYCSTKKLKTTSEILDKVITELGAAVKRQTSSMKDLLDIYMAGVLQMNYFLGAGLTHSEQEELVIEATQDLFRLLATQGYIENVFVAFVQLTENPNVDEQRRRGASYWATKMLHTFGMLSRMKRMYKEELDMNSKVKAVDFSTLNKPKISKIMRSLLIHSGVDTTLTLVFGESTKKRRSLVFEREFLMSRLGPLNIHSVPILKGLLPLVDPPLTDEQLEDVTKLSNIKMKTMNGATNIISDNKSMDITESEFENSEFGLWKLDKDNNWSKCALGVLPTK